MSEEQAHDSLTELAVEMGYNPEFEGEGKKTPKEFIQHGAKIQKNQSEKIKDLLGRVDGMTGEFEKMQTTFNNSLSAQQKKHQADLERQRTELDARIETAVDEADTVEFKRLDKERKELDKQAQDIVPDTNNDSEINQSEAQKYFNKWYSDKQWIKPGSDAEKEMNKAIALFRIDKGGRADILIDAESELAAAEKHLKEKFPDRFGLKPVESPPAGPGEGKSKGGSGNALKVSDLTADEKRSLTKWKSLLRDRYNEKQMLENIRHARQKA